MNVYSKILVINFVVLNLLVLLLHSVFVDIFVGLLAVFLVTLGVITAIIRTLIYDNPDRKKMILVLSLPAFGILMIINSIVASGSAQVCSIIFK
ncbi:hypothetical protein [Phosphitispora fastidiosa]|uniref:hypothetical protein n=1 Tax=Phosphitispora fastidiosa TaxID=2837202 RepID=UPI001E641804|nr:hypothetical protein [Phosphitispora fastidiosa]MBU7005342.1 membrane associated rhomboid family serine protease [Phosphitispora fastidiosa]